MARTKGSKNRPKEEIEASKKAPTTNLTGLKQKAPAKSYEQNKVYEYTPLAETALGATGLYNLYGVVIDCQTPSTFDKHGK